MTAGSQEYPSVVIDESGNFVIVWQHERDGNFDIYFQMYNSSNEAMGNNQKVNDDASTADQIDPSIAMDGNGNFIIAWEDWRNGNPDIYFQLFNSSGVAVGSNARANDNIGTTIQRFPSVAMNGRGDFVIAWEDYRFGCDNPDVFGQRYHSDGTPWGDNYRIVTNGPNYGEKAPTVTSTAETIIFSWIDNRDSVDGRWNVFGKIATWDWEGVVNVRERSDKYASKPPGFELLQNYPNPFNSTTTIYFSIPQMGKVKIALYDILGREIETISDELYSAGNHQITYNANERTSGIYGIKMKAGKFTQSKKGILLK